MDNMYLITRLDTINALLLAIIIMLTIPLFVHISGFYKLNKLTNKNISALIIITIILIAVYILIPTERDILIINSFKK